MSKNEKQLVALVRKISSSLDPTPYYEISFIKNVRSGERLTYDPTESELYRVKENKNES